jgi:cell division protease FtsH
MPSSFRPPQRSRQQWLFSALLVGLLLLLSFMFFSNPQRENEKKYAEATEVPLSRITQGYAGNEFKDILVRDNIVYATLKDDSVLQSYKENEDTVSRLGWNDPKNTTIVKVENREAANMFFAVLPDLLFFLLVIGVGIWFVRGIARSQSTALSFGKSRARIADAKQVKTRFADVAGAEEAKEDLVEVVDFLKNQGE